MKAFCTLLLAFSFILQSVAQALVNPDCEVNLGPDVPICNNAVFTLNPNGNPNATYTWTGPAGLSCYNCPSPTVSGLTTGSYTYIVTSQTPQCTDKDTIKIMVANGQQPQYNIADDQTICLGTSVLLGGTPFPNTFYQWTSNPPGFNASGPNPSDAPQATKLYYLIAFNATCPVVAVDSVLITVVSPPVLQVQEDVPICNGESILLGTTEPQAGVTYSWTPNNDGSLNNPNIANPMATPLQNTLYQLTASNGTCTKTESVLVSVVNLNLSLDVPDTVAVCKGTPLPVQATLTPPGSGTVTWSPLEGLQVSPDGLSVVATPLESTLYTVTASAPGCTRTLSVYVKVDSLPSDLNIIPSDDMICQGEIVKLVSTTYQPADFPNIEFTWTPAAGQLTPDSLYNMVVQPSETIVYQRITTSGACTHTDTVMITVIKPATMIATPAETLICPGDKVQLTVVYSPGVTDIKWSPETSLSCAGCDNPIAMPNTSTTYTVTGEFQGCPVNAFAKVNVRNLPVIQFPNDTQLCGGESITLNEVFDPTATYNWTSTDPNFIPTNDPKPVATPTLPMTTYFVQADNGCKNEGHVIVTVTNASLNVQGATTICQNQSTNLIANGSLPGSYQWSTGQSGQNIAVMPAVTTIYTVTYTYANGCTLTGQATVQVLGVAPLIVPPADAKLCPGESVTLNSLATPGASYSWVSNPPGYTSAQATPSVAPNQSTRYTVTATLGNCTTVQSVDVTVYNATLTLPDDITICRGETATITASGSLTGAYKWSSGDTTATIRKSPAQNTTYNVIYTYGDGCALTDAVKVTVKDNFTLKIVSDPDTNRLNVGDPLTLMAIVSPSQNLSNFQFQWLENGTTNVGNTETIELTTSTNETSLFYTLTASSPNGCVQDTTIEFILVQPSVVVPNAFSPNGDGVNDVFRLKVLEGSVTVLGVDIYNRWGKKIFSSTDPDAVWDGKMEGGDDAPSDVYVYMIRWQRGDGALQPPKKGDIALLR